MLLQQKRIRGTSKLKNIKDGTSLRIVVKDPELKLLEKMGFEASPKTGECILPVVIGPSTRVNAEGKIITHKDREKETCYRMIEWTYKQFCGRGETVDVTDSTYVPYERYERTQIPPLSIEFSIIEVNSSLGLSSPEFIFGTENERIIMAINVLLEYFGYCEVVSDDGDFIVNEKLIRLNWKVLPQGKYPWEKQKERLEPFLSRAKGKNREVIDKRLQSINKHEPDFTAIGQGGFSGYVIYGFTSLGLYVLESVAVNNATYVLNSNWEEVSKLSKAEILQNELHERRIIHAPGWYEEIDKLLK